MARRKRKGHAHIRNQHPSEAFTQYETPETKSETEELFFRGFRDAAPPKFDYSTSVMYDIEAAEHRMRGYLDCLDGLVSHGYPDPAFVEYLCEKVGREVPPPFFDRLMDEISKLRRRLMGLGNE